MLQRVREQIRVGAVFGPGPAIRPVWFDWRRRKHAVEQVTYHWRHLAGNALLLHFTVTDGSALYELIYNATDQLWTLETVDGEAS
ncbi:hypothetical protein GURASL_19280 [Geotalea uraniireducens]|uniref:Uncharacterized protein n=1 Tax=Geotalea uraniireducens TaxID=351604 RepID=A0ABM8EL05_9BACT|nr:hypothetical protein [Geotalea uraniireducens]BDV43005.1 hypothetical protein GURASL_19280 [Geotalea uraniireducens]